MKNRLSALPALLVSLAALFLAMPVFAGALEDMEEALIRGSDKDAIALINRGVDVNSVDVQGNTLLIQTIRRDMPEFFSFLVQKRARLNTRNRNGETAVSIAAFLGRSQYVQRLVEAGAEINYFGWTPLAYAAYNGHTDIVEYLIQHGAEVNGKTGNGSTPLFFAARYDHIDTVKALLKDGADPNALNENNDTAVDWAIKGKNTDIEDVLRTAGGRFGKSITIDVAK